MAFSRANFVQETSTTTGAGTYSLAGAVTGFQGFVAGNGDGATVRFSVTDGTDWEVCEGVITDGAPDTLTRATVLASSNAGAAVNWGAGSKTISQVFTAEEDFTDMVTEVVQVLVFDYATDVSTGDGAAYFVIPSTMDGFDLVAVHAKVITAGASSGTTDIQIHNVDNALDMLSTKLTIDYGETGSDTAATAAVIDTSNDHVNTNDVIRIDIDAISATSPKGLIVTLQFRRQ
jgi:hypothetical protein